MDPVLVGSSECGMTEKTLQDAPKGCALYRPWFYALLTPSRTLTPFDPNHASGVGGRCIQTSLAWAASHALRRASGVLRNRSCPRSTLTRPFARAPQVALMMDCQRTATVKSRSFVELGQLTRASFDLIMEQQHASRDKVRSRDRECLRGRSAQAPASAAEAATPAPAPFK